ncbi:Protein ERP5 [Nakaseomyces bracarensis]|uniref:Protein ERP5 n=1 Tax=Nakaseomyces bracarensis TaxID=273131 RepID=A0ABR4NUD5_9SACH
MKLQNVLFLGLIAQATALHTYVKSGEMKCFYKNLKKGDVLVGDLDTAIKKDGVYTEDPAVKVAVSIAETFDDDHVVMNQKNPYTGDFTFTAFDNGEHRICVSPTYPDTDEPIRVYLDLELSNIENLDTKGKQDETQLRRRVEQLSQRLNNIRREQSIIRENEAIFRDQSEAANSKITTWTIIQIIVLVGMCGFQINYLKKFFVKQKVI